MDTNEIFKQTSGKSFVCVLQTLSTFMFTLQPTALLPATRSYQTDSLSYNYKLRLFESQNLIPVVFYSLGFPR